MNLTSMTAVFGLFLAAVVVGALVAGLPNRATQRQNQLMFQQLYTHSRRLNDMLVSGDISTFSTLQHINPSPTVTHSQAANSNEYEVWRARQGVSSDDAFGFPVFPDGFDPERLGDPADQL